MPTAIKVSNTAHHSASEGDSAPAGKVGMVMGVAEQAHLVPTAMTRQGSQPQAGQRWTRQSCRDGCGA
jgi:hypothetical protein